MSGVRYRHSFIPLHVNIQLHLFKTLSLFHWVFLAHLWSINWPYTLRCISGLSFLFHWSICLFLMPVPNCFDDYSFIALLEIKKCDTSCFDLCQDFFGYSGSFVVSYKFQKCFFTSVTKCHWDVDRIWVEFIDGFWRYWHFNNINSSNPWTWNTFLFICVFIIFFHQYLIIFIVEIFLLFMPIYSKYFVVFDSIISEVNFIISILLHLFLF